MLGQATYIGSAGIAATLFFGYQAVGQGTDSGPIASGDTGVSTETGSRIFACFVQAFPRYTWSVIFGSGNPAGGDSIRQIGAFFSLTGTGATLLGFKASLSNSVIKGTSDTATYVWIVSIND